MTSNTISPNEAFEAYRVYQEVKSQDKAAEILGLSRSAVQRRVNAARKFAKQGDDESLDDFVTNVIVDTLNENGIVDLESVRHAWVKGDRASIFVRLKQSDEENFTNMCEAIIEDMKNYAPQYEKIHFTQGDHLLVIDPADVHIGKLVLSEDTGRDYNVKAAVDILKRGVGALASKASIHGLSQIVFVIGNDILHVDSKYHTTTKGTRQDVDGFHNVIWKAALDAYISCIETLTLYAPVHVVYCPSNHDEDSGYFLAQAVHAWFRNNPNVTFGAEQRQISKQDRKYVVFGENLMMFTHGDGAKLDVLVNIMPQEARELWGQTRLSYIYSHHLHHKKRSVYGVTPSKGEIEKDMPHVTVIKAPASTFNPTLNTYVETLRSPSPGDRWHSKSGYVNIQAIECFLHHPSFGQVARFTEIFF